MPAVFLAADDSSLIRQLQPAIAGSCGRRWIQAALRTDRKRLHKQCDRLTPAVISHDTLSGIGPLGSRLGHSAGVGPAFAS
jgi:hypothetical protein